MATELDTDKYEIINNEFRFTSEGRTLVVSQNGGLKFAILGYVLVQGIPADEDLKTTIERVEDYAETYDISFIEALEEVGGAGTTTDGKCQFIMKGVGYSIVGTNKLRANSQTVYDNAVENITDHLFGTFYVPTNEFMTKDGAHYGTYAFNFDRTYLSCKITEDVCFSHIILIGKQYAETDDATFVVDPRQDISVVAMARFSGGVNKETEAYEGGVQILADQNQYVTFQCQLRFTITDQFDEITEIAIEDDEVLDIAKKLALVNNGVKTLSGGITIARDQEILDELELGPDGAITTTKTLTVADCIEADDAENQFNAAALIHSINKYPEDGGEYVPQILLTTVHVTSALKEDITAYSVGMNLKAEGREPFYVNQWEASGYSAPQFKFGHVPENDYVAVDIFGIDNVNNMYVKDRFLFSNANSATMEGNGDPNVIINSDRNSFIRGTSTNTNSLINSDNNKFTDGTTATQLICSDMNQFSGGSSNILFDSNSNKIYSQSNNNTLYNSDNNRIEGRNSLYLYASQTSAGQATTDYFMIDSIGTSALGNSYDNTVFASDWNIFSGTSTQSLLIFSDRNNLQEDTKNLLLINSNDLSATGSYDDVVETNTNGKLLKTSNNSLDCNIYCSAVSANQNKIVRSRYMGVKGLELGSINSSERPIASDVQSNNNIVIRGEYFDLYGSSDNIIIDSYFLQSSDDSFSPGPVRIKGTTVVNSTKSKLYNAREMYLFNSEYSRINGTNNNGGLGLAGTSTEMTSTEEIDSIYYGEFYNTENVYAYYGLKGASYKAGAETLKDNIRPADMLRLKTQFTNTFGSELNLACFDPDAKVKYTTPYNSYLTFTASNRTLMNPSIRPTNSNIVGGHHNKIVGGQNVTILGAEYCKASTYEHQVLMGKFNKDVPADIIYGCGHFNGDTYVQGNKEYTEDELKTIETMSGTIDGVRGDGVNGNGETCFNALEFYAHQGKLVLRNCDDGHDRGNNVVSDNFGKSITLDPTGIVWRDSAGDITSELDISALKGTSEWTFICDIENSNTGTNTPEYKVKAAIGVPGVVANLASGDPAKLASYLFKVAEPSTTTTTSVFAEGELTLSNSVLFSQGIPTKINVVIMNLPVKSNGTTTKNWQFYNKIYPWYTSKSIAPRYNKAQRTSVEYYSKGNLTVTDTTTTTYTTQFMLNMAKSVLNSNLTCVTETSLTYDTKNWNNYGVEGKYQFAQKFDAYNTNMIYTEWLAEGNTVAGQINMSNYYIKSEVDYKIAEAKTTTDLKPYVKWDDLTGSNATAVTASKFTAGYALDADKVDGYHIDPKNTSTAGGTIAINTLA